MLTLLHGIVYKYISKKRSINDPLTIFFIYLILKNKVVFLEEVIAVYYGDGGQILEISVDCRFSGALQPEDDFKLSQYFDEIIF